MSEIFVILNLKSNFFPFTEWKIGEANQEIKVMKIFAMVLADFIKTNCVLYFS
jgi:hypothetical protein